MYGLRSPGFGIRVCGLDDYGRSVHAGWGLGIRYGNFPNPVRERAKQMSTKV